MKLVPDSLDEAMDFERGVDPKKTMGLGKRVQIEKDLEDADINPENVEIQDNLVLIFKGYSDDDQEKVYKIQLKHLNPDAKKFLKGLRGSNPTSAVDQALEDGVDHQLIEDLIQNYGKFKDGYQTTDNKSKAWIYYKKQTRDEEKRAEDEEENTYAFIAFPDKIPVEINGKKYYEDGWGTEGMMKIDKYDPASLHNISGMKLRTRYAGHDSNVYFIRVPKDFMDEERYDEFPEIIQQNFDEYLKRGIINRI